MHDKQQLLLLTMFHLALPGLQKHYSVDSPDYQDCQVALGKIVELTAAFAELIKHLENLQKLIELQRDLVGMDTLVVPNRVGKTCKFTLSGTE